MISAIIFSLAAFFEMNKYLGIINESISIKIFSFSRMLILLTATIGGFVMLNIINKETRGR